jgi:nitroimidazol reductase NimA-like FMN-containing flavoprotein (pyridoxamine 5'-phosphate oxidase superfamily)
VNLTGDWSRERVDGFLLEARVPLRLSCQTPDGELWMLSLWYRWRDGAFECATSASADVVGYLEADPRVAVEVSTNDPPYRGVRGAGRASIEPDADKALIRALLERYIGDTDSTLAERLLAPEREEVRITVAPVRLYAWDFSARMRDAV